MAINVKRINCNKGSNKITFTDINDRGISGNKFTIKNYSNNSIYVYPSIIDIQDDMIKCNGIRVVTNEHVVIDGCKSTNTIFIYSDDGGEVEIINHGDSINTIYTGSIIKTPLSDNTITDPIGDEDLYSAYDITVNGRTLALSAIDLKLHHNADGDTGYWVGVSIETPSGVDYTDIKYAWDDASLATAGLSEADRVVDDVEYIDFIVDAGTYSYRTLKLSFNGVDIHTFYVDCSNVSISR